MVKRDQYLVLTDRNSHFHNHYYNSPALFRITTCSIPKLHSGTHSGNNIGNGVQGFGHCVAASCATV